MDVTIEISYPGATLERVVAMLLDPAFREEVCTATGALEHDVSVQPGEDGAAGVHVSRVLPAEVPAFVRSFVGDTITLVQDETWQPSEEEGTRRADLALQVTGQPATMKGRITVTESAEGVAQEISGALKVSVPFVAGKIETEIAKGLEAAGAKEQEVGRAWLAR